MNMKIVAVPTEFSVLCKTIETLKKESEWSAWTEKFRWDNEFELWTVELEWENK